MQLDPLNANPRAAPRALRQRPPARSRVEDLAALCPRLEHQYAGVFDVALVVLPSRGDGLLEHHARPRQEHSSAGEGEGDQEGDQKGEHVTMVPSVITPTSRRMSSLNQLTADCPPRAHPSPSPTTSQHNALRVAPTRSDPTDPRSSDPSGRLRALLFSPTSRTCPGLTYSPTTPHIAQPHRHRI